MLRVLIPVDGSDNAIRAVKFVMRKAPLYKEPLEIHLLNVQHSFPGTIRGVHHQAQEFHHEEGLKALASARKLLDDAGVKYAHHIGVGDAAEVIAHYVKDKRIEQLVMGTRGLGSASNLLLGSVATKVIHLTDIPVLLVK
jgi:nucleotide-binding universal stress UspA family protein